MSLAPWLALGAVLATAAAGYRYGGQHERNGIEAQTARDERIARMAIDAANSVTGQAIARIRGFNTTIKGEVEREIRTNTVYADCRHAPEQLQRINAALAGRAAPGAGGGGVPAADPAR